MQELNVPLAPDPSLGHIQRPPGRCGFTLLELLVVIPVIAVLAALLLPLLARAKQSARRAHCTSNLHQIAAALGMYVDDFKRYPAYVWLAGPEARSNYWDYQVLGYAGGNKAVFLCPGNRAGNNDASSNWDGIQTWQANRLANKSYGFNTYGVGLADNRTSLGLNLYSDLSWLFGQPDSAIVAPADMIALADYDPAIDDDGNGDHPDYLFFYCLTGKRHNGGAVVAFCDAHVEYGKTNSWAAPAYIVTQQDNMTRSRWNIDHQPHLLLKFP